eukprot:7277638-Prymnesium_polylepis.1
MRVHVHVHSLVRSRATHTLMTARHSISSTARWSQLREHNQKGSSTKICEPLCEPLFHPLQGARKYR